MFHFTQPAQYDSTGAQEIVIFNVNKAIVDILPVIVLIVFLIFLYAMFHNHSIDIELDK